MPTRSERLFIIGVAVIWVTLRLRALKVSMDWWVKVDRDLSLWTSSAML